MINLLTDRQAKHRREQRDFADEQIAPRAAAADQNERFDLELIRSLAASHMLGSLIPNELGGTGTDSISYGLMTEEIGRTCQTTRNFVACTDMVADTILHWGSDDQRARWLRPIIAGQVMTAFALTEPGTGSDAAAISARARECDGGFRIDGTKRWISFAQIADLLVVFAMLDGRHSAFLVERDTPGLTVEPITGMLGLRGSMLGEIRLDGCRIPAANLVGRPGSGLVFVASASLGLGRYSTAWGAVGLAQACANLSTDHAAGRVQFGSPIADHQLVMRLRADMLTEIAAARLLCYYAGVCREVDAMDVETATLMAKYKASVTAGRSSASAVEIFGARGVTSGSPVERMYRDAKVLEIIEGASELQQILIGQSSDPSRDLS